MDIKSGNQLFGKAWGWEEEPSESPNSYPMTDDTLFPSNIKVLINGNEKGLYNLIDDPADHRGILSWHNQITPKGPIQDDVLWEFGSASLNEAGSYGYLVKIPISIKELNESIKNGNLKLKIETIGEGGLAIYGKSFGRYPFNPSIVIIK
jgi:predicted transcriptional regulator